MPYPKWFLFIPLRLFKFMGISSSPPLPSPSSSLRDIGSLVRIHTNIFQAKMKWNEIDCVQEHIRNIYLLCVPYIKHTQNLPLWMSAWLETTHINLQQYTQFGSTRLSLFVSVCVMLFAMPHTPLRHIYALNFFFLIVWLANKKKACSFVLLTESMSSNKIYAEFHCEKIEYIYFWHMNHVDIVRL